MPDTIKIGITENLSKRIKDLDNTSTPLPFECFYALEVEDAIVIEKLLMKHLMTREFVKTESSLTAPQNRQNQH